MLELDTCYISETGGRQRNEDACGYWQSGSSGCWVLSDGAGGHGSGDVASRLVVQTVLHGFRSRPEVSCGQGLALLQAAQEAVVWEKTAGATRDDMHATAVVLLIDRDAAQAVFAHVGDSRLYHFRQGRILSQTRDHSLVQQMVDAGFGSVEMIRSHPKRSLLTSAMGAAGRVEMSVSPQPLQLLAGDVFLLCSDGWWELLQEAEMETALERHPVGAQWLADMAATIRNRAPAGYDNYSALCVSSLDDRTVMLERSQS